MAYVAAGPVNAVAAPAKVRSAPVWFFQEGATTTVSPGSSRPLPFEEAPAEGSTARARAAPVGGSTWHFEEQPSPSAVLPSSQPSRPSRTLLPQVEEGSVPVVAALFFGEGRVAMKSLALSVVSSQASSVVAPPQMSSRRV